MIKKIPFLLLIIIFCISGQVYAEIDCKGGSQGFNNATCEDWSKSDDAKRGCVCTDLLEGIPMDIINNTPNTMCIREGIVPGTENDDNSQRTGMCVTIVSPTGILAFTALIAMIYRYASWAIGILAVLVIIMGGITMSIGGASQESVTKGKKLIFQAIGGVILFFLIGVILHTINPNFF